MSFLPRGIIALAIATLLSVLVACEYGPDNSHADDQCDGVFCPPNACFDDSECADNEICEFHQCRKGCRPSNNSCDSDHYCNDLTLLCEPLGCTPTSCRPTIQTCNLSREIPACEFTGACFDDVHCLAYARQQESSLKYSCDSNSNRCVEKPACDVDSDCVVGQICAVMPDGGAQCIDGCRQADDCAPEQVCSAHQGAQCVQRCSSDEHCLMLGGAHGAVCRDDECRVLCSEQSDCPINGQICAGAPRYCQGCRTDSDCRPTHHCVIATEFDEGLCQALPQPCENDAYGNNHAFESAYFIEALPFLTHADEQPVFCGDNVDGEWFQFDVDDNKLVDIKLNYDHSKGNLEVALFDADQHTLLVANSPSPNAPEHKQLRYGIADAGTYFIQVRGVLNTDSLAYSLSIDANNIEQCSHDELEPNTGDNPYFLESDRLYNDLTTCRSDADYYYLDIAGAQIVRIHAQSQNSFGGISLELYDDRGEFIRRADDAVDEQSLYFESTMAQRLTLKVVNNHGIGPVDYSLSWTQFRNRCVDQFGSHNSCQQAAELAHGQFDSLALCAAEEYYRLTLLPQQTVTISATYDAVNAAGELDLFLFGPNNCASLLESGIELASPPGQEASSNIIKSLSYQVQQGGDYYLATKLFQGIYVPYSLAVEIDDGALCDDDRLSPNQSADHAYALSREQIFSNEQTALTGLKLCDGKDDWFMIDLEPGDSVKWEVIFDAEDGEIFAELIAPDQHSVVQRSVSVGAGVAQLNYINHSIPAEHGSGLYYLKITSVHPTRAPYRLHTFLNDIGPINPQCPDQFGDNHTRDQAVEISPGSYRWAMVCGQPLADKWFTTWMSAGEAIAIDISPAQDSSQITIQLFDDSSAGTPISQGHESDGTITVNYTSSRDQYVYYRIFTQPSVPWQLYHFDVEVTAAPGCRDDRFAGNPAIESAARLNAPGLYTQLQKCENQSDWYRLTLDAGDIFEAFMRFDGSQADIDISLYGPDPISDDPSVNEPIVLDISDSLTSNESIIHEVARSGDYFLKVDDKSPARASYDLLLYRNLDDENQLIGPPDRHCPDIFENNDTRATAQYLTPGNYSDLSLCWGAPNDPDYYSVFVPANTTLVVDINFNHSDGDIQMRAFRADSSIVVAQSTTNSDNESISIINEGIGRYYIIHLYGAGGSFHNYYSMNLQLIYDGPCLTSPLAGPGIEDAATLPAGAYDAVQLCDGDEHWFAIHHNVVRDIRIFMALNRRFGDLEMTLYRDSGELVASSRESNNIQGIEVLDAPTDVYFLQIRAQNNAMIRTSYDLWASFNNQTPQQPYCSDPYERNDDQSMAFPLDIQTQRQYSDMLACGIEEDWYEMTLLGNTPYRVDLFYDGQDGITMGMEVRNGLGNVLVDTNGQQLIFDNSSTDLLNDQVDYGIEFIPPLSGSYFLGIQNQSETPISHSYYLTVERANAPCADDNLSPNHSIATASRLWTPGTFALGACPDSSGAMRDDYFLFTAPHSGVLQIDIYFNRDNLQLVGAVNSLIPNMDASTPGRLRYTEAVTAYDELMIYIGATEGQGQYFMRIEY